MPTTIFRPTSLTNQNRPKVKISNFCVFCPIWMKFGIGANTGRKTTWYNFEMTTASTDMPQIPSRTTTFRFFFKWSLEFQSLAQFILFEFLELRINVVDSRRTRDHRTISSPAVGPFTPKRVYSSFKYCFFRLLTETFIWARRKFSAAHRDARGVSQPRAVMLLHRGKRHPRIEPVSWMSVHSKTGPWINVFFIQCKRKPRNGHVRLSLHT